MPCHSSGLNTDSLTAGSPLWQTVFISFAIAFVLLEVLRGWRLGLMRQLVRVAAVIAAYASAFFGGRAIAPFLRETIKAPDVVISSVAGAVLAFVVYLVISGVGAFLFKRTAQHESRGLRLILGSTGAFVGIFFALFFVWLILLGVRSVGAIADAQMRARPERLPPLHEFAGMRVNDEREDTETRASKADELTALLARLKNSVELGPVGEIVKKTDVLPAGSYQVLGEGAEVFARPETATRFFSFPGARALSEHPKIVALRNDPEIAKIVRDGRFLDLLKNDRLIDALNDHPLLERAKHFDLKRALEYALENH